MNTVIQLMESPSDYNRNSVMRMWTRVLTDFERINSVMKKLDYRRYLKNISSEEEINDIRLICDEEFNKLFIACETGIRSEDKARAELIELFTIRGNPDDKIGCCLKLSLVSLILIWRGSR